jgi:hypothetical protein
MSTNARKIKRALKELSSENGKADNGNLFFTAEVKKVDDETCDVEFGGFTHTGVHLAAVSDGNKNNLIIKPKVGSIVLICDKTGGDLTWLNVVAFSEIASVTMKVDEIVINEGKNDGLVIVGKLVEKINRLEGKLKSHQHGYIPYPGGVASAPVSTTPASGLLPPDLTLQFNNTEQSEVENEKIKH